MHRGGPGFDRMAFGAECRRRIVLNQELAVLVAMRVMARGALHLAAVVQAHLAVKRMRVLQLALGSHQRRIVSERNGMMARKVRAQATLARRNRANALLH